MKKLEDAVRRFGLPGNVELYCPSEHYGGDPSPRKTLSNALNLEAAFMSADAGNEKQLQAHNLRLKLEVNRLQALLNERDEEIDHLRNPKPLRWVFAAVLVVAMFVAHAVWGF